MSDPRRQARPGRFEFPASQPADAPFGASLEPVLYEACRGLSDVHWFRTDWQRGGALTGYGEYRDGGGAAHAVVVKLPVTPFEQFWLQRLQPFEGLVPALHACGTSLNGYDMAWVVMERLPHGPLDTSWQGCQFDLLADAAGRFYAAAAPFPIDRPAPDRDWSGILKRAREAVQSGSVAHTQRWKQALKKAGRHLDLVVPHWERRSLDWCHGDLHLANAMTRHPPPAGPAVLIDFAACHAGHWVEDGVYFEHLFWAHRDVLGGRKVCSLIAKQRKRHGLRVDDDWPQLASIHRILLAVGTPAVLTRDGDQEHVQAVLETLEQMLV